MLRALAVSALTLAAVMFSAAPAGADVNVTADYPVRDGYATLDFHASSDSETKALLTQFIVALPNQTWVSAEQMPGWTVRLDPDFGPGRSVTWTAAPGGGTPPNQFASFRIMMKLPNTDEVSLPATQVYSDGTVVHWDQKPLPSGIKPEHPAPMLTLTAPEDTQQNTHSASQPAPPDATARWLAVGALVVALLAAALALSGRRRS
jgi:uncharacterized protein YcnI